jgi:hypothetical protein
MQESKADKYAAQHPEPKDTEKQEEKKSFSGQGRRLVEPSQEIIHVDIDPEEAELQRAIEMSMRPAPEDEMRIKRLKRFG